MRISDWSSDVCSSDLEVRLALRLHRPDGSVRHVELCAAPVADNGRDVGFVASIQDVTSAHETNQLLEQQAHSDPLTGLPNRSVLAEVTAEVAARCESALLLDRKSTRLNSSH